MRVVTGLNKPYGIAVNSRREMIVSESETNQISVFDNEGKKIHTFGSHDSNQERMIEPRGIAVDEEDNIYVSSVHKLQKFTSSGKLIKCVGQLQRGSGKEEFDDPHGVTQYNNHVYICDRNNHRIQVYDLDLNFVRSICSRGIGVSEFKEPFDVKFDTTGNMYIAEYSKQRVQVIDSNGCLIQEFGQEGIGKLKGPTALHIIDKFVYISDFSAHCIVVYGTSGQFVTKFGKRGHEEGEFTKPYCITSSANGFIYVCDWSNDRVQIFKFETLICHAV